jgi:hypothetical protein
MEKQISDALWAVYEKLIAWIQQFIVMLPNIIVATIIFTVFYIVGKQVRKWVTKPFRAIVLSISQSGTG